MRLKFPLLLFCSILVACTATSLRAEIALGRLDGYPAPVLLNSGISKKQTLVIRNIEQWRKVWIELHSKRTPVPEVPEIDFKHYTAVVFVLGTQRSGGYAVRITSAAQLADSVRLTVEIRRPSAGCIVTAAMTSPADIVLLPMVATSVVVDEISVEADC